MPPPLPAELEAQIDAMLAIRAGRRTFGTARPSGSAVVSEALRAERDRFDRICDDGRVWVQMVPAGKVPLGARQIAGDVSCRAALATGLPDNPRITWYRPVDAATADDLDYGRRTPDDVLAFRERPTVHGFVLVQAADTVYLDAGQPPDNLAHVVAHEVRHIWQHQCNRGRYTPTEAEADAEAFARKVLA